MSTALLSLALLATLVAQGAQAAATGGLQIAQGGGAVFPQRALVVAGQGLAGLTARRVHVLENGVPVRQLTVHSLKEPDATDFGVVLVIDVSAFAPTIERARQYAVGLGAQRPAGQLFGLVEADASPPVALGLTRERAAIQSALGSVPPTIARHGLQMYPAALLAVEQLASAKIRAGFVVVLTDGADHGTPSTLHQLVASATAAHVRIYAVGIRSRRFSAPALKNMARLTGGEFFAAAPSQLGTVFTDIESSLTSQYLISYDSVQGPGKQISSSIRIDGIPGTYNISYLSPTLTQATVRRGRPVPSFWTSSGAVLVISVGVVLLLALAIMILVAKRERPLTVRDRVQEVLHAAPERSLAPVITVSSNASPVLDRAQAILERTNWWEGFVGEVEVAQVTMSPIELVALTVAGMLLVGAIIDIATGSLIAAILAFLATPFVARFVLHRRLLYMQRLFEEQLAEHLQEVAAAMRAGRSLVDSFALITEAASEPTRREFEIALADERIGMPFDEALSPIATRMDNEEMTQVALIAKLDRGTGASTAEVLDRVAENVRENTEIRRELRTMTAQVRLSGWVLSVLPLVILLAVSLLDPSYEHPMYHTTLGVVLLIVSGLMVLAGSLIMRRLVKVEF